MNHAHENMKDYAQFNEVLVSAEKENRVLLGELTNAIEKGQLSLHYQPKIDIQQGQVCAVEALMRWSHPEKGHIPPGVFIPCAESSTLIEPLTFFAIDAAAKQIVRWQAEGIDLPIAVNISPFNLNQPGFAKSVISILDKHNVSPSMIELEVTENALMLDIECCARELSLLDNAGVEISVDDFGTGYSSLQYLSTLPMSKLKIDQSFVKHLPDDVLSTHIVDASITMAHKLEMKVVAEGVEDLAVYRFLEDKHCDYAQGYFISRPLAEADFQRWYQNFKMEKLVLA